MKTNPMWIEDLHVKPKAITSLEETGPALQDTAFGNEFWELNQGMHKDNDKLDCIKMKRFHTSGDTLNISRKQPTGWDKDICKHYF